MSDLTQQTRQDIVNYLRGAGAPTAISDVFVDAYNGDPQASGTSVLATITGSATRPSIKSLMAAATAAAPAVSTNSGSLQLTAAAVAGGSITHIALFDAATAGNMKASKALTSGTQTVTAGNPVSVPASAVSISI